MFEPRIFPMSVKTLCINSGSIKKKIGLPKGSGVPNKEKVGKLTKAQIEEIAKEKMKDLNADTIEAAMNIVRGTARSMGVETE